LSLSGGCTDANLDSRIIQMGLLGKHSGPPSKDKFAKLLMDRIRKAGETGDIAYEQEEFRLRGESKGGSILFLSNLYQEYCTAPVEQRDTILKRCVRNWFAHLLEMPEDSGDAKPDIVDPENWTTTLSRIPGRIGPDFGGKTWERSGDGSRRP
jgi:hypothetical protein